MLKVFSGIAPNLSDKSPAQIHVVSFHDFLPHHLGENSGKQNIEYVATFPCLQKEKQDKL